jgi:hypothetical protein
VHFAVVHVGESSLNAPSQRGAHKLLGWGLVDAGHNFSTVCGGG